MELRVVLYSCVLVTHSLYVSQAVTAEGLCCRGAGSRWLYVPLVREQYSGIGQKKVFNLVSYACGAGYLAQGWGLAVF